MRDGGVHVATEVLGGGDTELAGMHRAGVEIGVGGLIGCERGEAPPFVTEPHGVFTDLTERPVGGGSQVDGRGAAAGRGRPAGTQELLTGRDQFDGAGPHQLRGCQQHQGPLRKHVGDQLQAVHQDGDQGLHPLDRMPLGETGEHIRELRMLPLKGFGPLPDRTGEQQLPAGLSRDLPQLLTGGALVGDGERPDLGHLVAKEVDTNRLFRGGWEDVHDPAAHRELASPLHQVDAVVRRIHQRLQQTGQVAFLASLDGDGSHCGQVLDLRLKQGAHGRDHHLRRRVRGKPPQHGQALADGVGPG